MRIALTLAALLMVAARVNADDAAKAAKPLPTDDDDHQSCRRQPGEHVCQMRRAGGDFCQQ